MYVFVKISYTRNLLYKYLIFSHAYYISLLFSYRNLAGLKVFQFLLIFTTLVHKTIPRGNYVRQKPSQNEDSILWEKSRDRDWDCSLSICSYHFLTYPI